MQPLLQPFFKIKNNIWVVGYIQDGSRTSLCCKARLLDLFIQGRGLGSQSEEFAPATGEKAKN